jgi:hypothetical protein
MMILFMLARLWLATLTAWVGRKAGKFEKRYAKAALAAEKVANEVKVKPGNASAADPLANAKKYYTLGHLVEDRDRLEGKYLAWQARADRLRGTAKRVGGYKGRLVPYLVGAADVALVLVALHYLGLPHGLSQETVKEFVSAVVKR